MYPPPVHSFTEAYSTRGTNSTYQSSSLVFSVLVLPLNPLLSVRKPFKTADRSETGYVRLSHTTRQPTCYSYTYVLHPLTLSAVPPPSLPVSLVKRRPMKKYFCCFNVQPSSLTDTESATHRYKYFGKKMLRYAHTPLVVPPFRLCFLSFCCLSV